MGITYVLMHSPSVGPATWAPVARRLPGSVAPSLTHVGAAGPPWTSWWDESEVAPMFPDAATRRIVEAEQPRLPLSYYEQLVPAPPGWDDPTCGYVLFAPPYDTIAAACGWPVEHLPGRHLHQLVDPAAVAEAIRKLSHSG
jgi:hypothetical protein